MARATVNKTYKLYIGGKFVRSESGRYLKVSHNGETVNVCRGSRKDIRDAVKVARGAHNGWASRTAFNRSQILYRLAEMLESRTDQFVGELVDAGAKRSAAVKEVELSVDRLIHFAGWCDKYNQVFSSVNPVASNHFNFSTFEPQGVVSIMLDAKAGLLGLITTMAHAICGGNTVVMLTQGQTMVTACAFGEVLATSDVPGGVVNIVCGSVDELLKHMAGHMDVNAIYVSGLGQEQLKEVEIQGVENMKRVVKPDSSKKWSHNYWNEPQHITALQEVKTTWHPIERIGAAGSAY